MGEFAEPNQNDKLNVGEPSSPQDRLSMSGISSLPLSENRHPETMNMDRCSSEQLLELFSKTDREVIDALSSENALRQSAALLECWQNDSPGQLILAGAGTSGRLAFVLQKQFGDKLASIGIKLVPWIAGGSRAIKTAVEGAEDNIRLIRSELEAVFTEGDSFYTGITCGLSAPCVAAGLLEALNQGCPAALFGSNPLEQARSNDFAEIKGGMRSVVERFLAEGTLYPLTPQVGPEPLTGSTRMKGASATWLVFDALFSCLTEGKSGKAALQQQYKKHFEAVERKGLDPEAAVRIEEAGRALRAGGRIFYLADGEAALAAVLDASECKPTFGASAEQVQAYVAGGWNSVVHENVDVSELEAEYPASLQYFHEFVKPTLSADDIVFCLGRIEAPVLPQVKIFQIPEAGFLQTKLALNALSTGAFARAGYVYQNLMINLNLSNTKIVNRAARIVSALAEVSPAQAHQSLVAAVFDIDNPDSTMKSLPAAELVREVRSGIVPLAILHAKGISLTEARAVLEKEPVIRRAVEKYL